MPKFIVPITRDVTETADVIIHAAKNIEDARNKAVRLACIDVKHGQTLLWERDDCMGGEPYLADPDSGEEVEDA